MAMAKIKELVQYDNLIHQSRKQEKESGLKQKDIDSALAKNRLDKLASQAIRD
jgi:hypothetical protein